MAFPVVLDSAEPHRKEGATMTRSVLSFTLGILLVSLAADCASAQFIEKKTISLATAKKMAASAETEAAKNGWNMVITVVDDGGNLVYTERMDGAQIASIQISQGKAHTALAFRRPTKDLQDAVTKGNTSVLKLDPVTPVQGGLPIAVDGKIIGAIGVSGAQSAQDEQCAQAGLNALNEK
jgi:glc operon protein GlcG